MRRIVVDGAVALERLAEQHAPALFALTEASRAHLPAWLPRLDHTRT